MAKLLMVVSSARTIRLADGSDHPTGYLAEEVLEPYETFRGCGRRRGDAAAYAVLKRLTE